MKTRNKAVPAAYVILEKDGKILFGRRQNTGYKDGMVQMPAGHIEESEAPTSAAIREMKEEVGIDIDRADLEFVHLLHRPRHDETGDRIDIFFRARKWRGDIVNAEPNKCAELMWVDPADLPADTVPHIRLALEKIYAGIPFNETSLDFLDENGYVV